MQRRSPQQVVSARTDPSIVRGASRRPPYNCNVPAGDLPPLARRLPNHLASNMGDELIQIYSTGVLGALAVFEIVAALASWIAVPEPARKQAFGELWFTRPNAIRDHFVASRSQRNELRSRYPVLREPRHARLVRGSIRHLLQTPPEAAGCGSCRDSRLHGRSRCIECDRRLVAPPMEGRT
jgi:hypothetical protein